MIKSRFLYKNYYIQNTTNVLDNISNFLFQNKLLINNNFLLNQKNNKEALYSFSDNFINIYLIIFID